MWYNIIDVRPKVEILLLKCRSNTPPPPPPPRLSYTDTHTSLYKWPIRVESFLSLLQLERAMVGLVVLSSVVSRLIRRFWSMFMSSLLGPWSVKAPTPLSMKDCKLSFFFFGKGIQNEKDAAPILILNWILLDCWNAGSDLSREIDWIIVFPEMINAGWRNEKWGISDLLLVLFECGCCFILWSG